MTTVENLQARKQQLLVRLHNNPSPKERKEVERLLAQIDTALDLLKEPVGKYRVHDEAAEGAH